MKTNDKIPQGIIKREIATVKPRKFVLELSDEDVARLFRHAVRAGTVPEKLLEAFVADLVCGTFSENSDSRMYADNWYENEMLRKFPSNNSLLKFLTDELYDIPRFLASCDEFEKEHSYLEYTFTDNGNDEFTHKYYCMEVIGNYIVWHKKVSCSTPWFNSLTEEYGIEVLNPDIELEIENVREQQILFKEINKPCKRRKYSGKLRGVL